VVKIEEEHLMQLERIDHVVFTVHDIDVTCDFYSRALGMEVVTFAAGRKALRFGRCRINLHQRGREFEPKAANPAPGTQDICLVTSTAMAEVIEHLQSVGVEIIEGPVPRTGAIGPMESVYFRDPDGNLVEVAHYPSS
jgi:catechol 2,3-dioxygenase-like lactoylglutathione lyase family enzyme